MRQWERKKLPGPSGCIFGQHEAAAVLREANFEESARAIQRRGGQNLSDMLHQRRLQGAPQGARQ